MPIDAAGPGRVSRDATSTRLALVEAAIDCLLELSLTHLISAVGTRTIAARAGVSPATLFHHFGSAQNFGDAVLRRVFDSRRPSSDVEIGVGVDEIRRTGLPVGTAQAFHASEYRRLSGDREHRLRVGLWALGGQAGREGYGTYMRERDAPLHAFARRLHDGWGRELRPPTTIAGYVAAHAALLSGSVIRGSVDPASIDETSFARSAATLGLVMLRVKGERRDLDSRLAEINYWPSPNGATRIELAARRQPQRSRIIASAHSMMWDRGYDSTTLSDVARSAGVHVSTIHSLFDGKADLAICCLLESVCTDGDAERLSSWRSQVERLSSSLARTGHLLRPYAQECIAGDRSRSHDPIRDVLTAALQAGIDSGDLAITDPLPDVVHVMLIVLLTRLISHPHLGPQEAATWAGQAVLRGQSHTPAPRGPQPT